MRHQCTECDYSTDNLSNYNKHLKSDRHLKINTSAADDNGNNKKICKCGKIFVHKSSLSRHRKTCNMLQEPPLIQEIKMLEQKDKQISQLINSVNTLITKVDNLETEVKDSKQMTQINNINNSKNTYINISLINFLQQNYSDAPSLPQKINYKNKTVVELLIDNYLNDSLHRYLGDLIIQNYKKEDPSQQSVWASDVARLNYLVKELINKESKWMKDHKGEKVKKYIVNPLLKHVDKTCNEYLKENEKKFSDWGMKLANRTITFDAIEEKHHDKFSNIRSNTSKLIKYINKGDLADDIIKYIAPKLILDKERKLHNDIEIKEENEDEDNNYFSDDEIIAIENY